MNAQSFLLSRSPFIRNRFVPLPVLLVLLCPGIGLSTAAPLPRPTVADEAGRNVSIGVAAPMPADLRTAEGFDPAASAGLFVGIRVFDDKERFVEVEYAVDDAVDLAHLFIFTLELVDAKKAVLCLSGDPVKPESAERLKKLAAGGARVLDAAQSTIYKQLGDQAAAAQPDGLYIITIATHGFSDQGIDYLVASDTICRRIERTGVAVNEVFDEMDRTKTGRQFVLLDACRERLSSQTRAGGADPVSPMGKAFSEAIANASGQVILSGTVLGGYSYDDDQRKNGVFTGAIIDGLTGGALPDERGFITAESLAEYVNDRVAAWVKENRPDHIERSRGIERKIAGDGSRLPLAVDPKAVEEFKVFTSRCENAERSLKLRLDSRSITQSVIGEVSQSLAFAPRAQAERLLKKVELLEREEGYTPQDFALYWNNQGREEFASVVDFNSMNGPSGAPAWMVYAVVTFLVMLTLFMTAILIHLRRQRDGALVAASSGAATPAIERPPSPLSRPSPDNPAPSPAPAASRGRDNRIDGIAAPAPAPAPAAPPPRPAQTPPRAPASAAVPATPPVRRRASPAPPAPPVPSVSSTPPRAPASAAVQATPPVSRSAPPAPPVPPVSSTPPRAPAAPPRVPAAETIPIPLPVSQISPPVSQPPPSRPPSAAPSPSSARASRADSVITQQALPSQPRVFRAESPISQQSPPPLTAFPGTSRVRTIDLGGGVSMDLIHVRGGTFNMGSMSNEKDRSSDENQVTVKLTEDFWIGEAQVTQAQWQAVMGTNPSKSKGGANLPVEQVSWLDVVAFCEKLAKSSQLPLRLPTEAEWEYACRAGSSTRFCFGSLDTKLGDYAWYSGNSGGKTHPVKMKKPNEWGLYDMHGNVWEWCADWYAYSLCGGSDPTGAASGTDRVLRGGSWGNSSRFCRSACRIRFEPRFRGEYLGFRVVVAVR